MLFCKNCNKLVTPVIKLSGNGEKRCSVCSLPLSEHRQITPGTNLCGFIIEREIGRGGMGVVYLARQINLNRHVAIKILSDELASDSKFVDAFFHEARSAANLSHPNIVQAYDAGVTADMVYYFVMELAEGENLDAKVAREGALAMPLAMNVAVRISEALDYAWDHCMLCHGDIKPENIILTNSGAIKLADLGLAKDFREENPYSDTELMATPAYAPPEVIRGELHKIGVKSDMYSFGATLYHIFTGHPPFSGDDPEVVCNKQLNEQCAPLICVDKAKFPERLSVLVDKLMEKDPSKRPESWGVVSRELLAIAEAMQEKKTAPRLIKLIPPPQKRVHKEKSSPLFAVAVVLGVAVLVLLGVFVVLLNSGKCSSPRSARPQTPVSREVSVPEQEPVSRAEQEPVLAPLPVFSSTPPSVSEAEPEAEPETETESRGEPSEDSGVDDDISLSLSLTPEENENLAPVPEEEISVENVADETPVSESAVKSVPDVLPPPETPETPEKTEKPEVPAVSEKAPVPETETPEAAFARILETVRGGAIPYSEQSAALSAWFEKYGDSADEAVRSKASSLTSVLSGVQYPVYIILADNAEALEGSILFPGREKLSKLRFLNSDEKELHLYSSSGGRARLVTRVAWKDFDESEIKYLVCNQLIFSPVFERLGVETQKRLFIQASFLYKTPLRLLEKRYRMASKVSGGTLERLIGDLKLAGAK